MCDQLHQPPRMEVGKVLIWGGHLREHSTTEPLVSRCSTNTEHKPIYTLNQNNSMESFRNGTISDSR